MAKNLKQRCGISELMTKMFRHCCDCWQLLQTWLYIWSLFKCCCFFSVITVVKISCELISVRAGSNLCRSGRKNHQDYMDWHYGQRDWRRMSNTLNRFLIVSYLSADSHNCLGWTAGVFSISTNHLTINQRSARRREAVATLWGTSLSSVHQTTGLDLSSGGSPPSTLALAEVTLLLDLLLVVCRLSGSIPAVIDEPEHGIGSV